MLKTVDAVIIKEHSSDKFETELLLFVQKQERFGKTCKTQFQPLMQLNGKPLYMALVEVTK